MMKRKNICKTLHQLKCVVMNMRFFMRIQGHLLSCFVRALERSEKREKPCEKSNFDNPEMFLSILVWWPKIALTLQSIISVSISNRLFNFHAASI